MAERREPAARVCGSLERLERKREGYATSRKLDPALRLGSIKQRETPGTGRGQCSLFVARCSGTAQLLLLGGRRADKAVGIAVGCSQLQEVSPTSAERLVPDAALAV